MLKFFIKRYTHKVFQYRQLLFLPLLPLALYLGIMALRTDLYTIYQDIALSKYAPAALSTSPTDFTQMSFFIDNPHNFFLDTVSLMLLFHQLTPGTNIDPDSPQYAHIKSEMSLTGNHENTIRVAYRGKDQDAGKNYVDFYSKLLLQKAQEGQKRKDAQLTGSLPNQETIVYGTQNPNDTSADYHLLKGIVIHPEKTLWRPDRLRPSVVLLFAGLITVLFIFGLLEFFDPSFKSERQIAHYLGSPVLGTMPNLHIISQSIVNKPNS